MTYRVGIVGSGFGGAVHAPSFALHPQFEPLAIASPNRANAIARERSIPHAFPSFDAMLAELGDRLDVIAVATPPGEHHRVVLAALAAGKHVLCEKPFALRLADAEEMVAAAARSGVATALAFEYRYGSAPQALKELVVNGHLPRLREVEVTRFGTELQASRPRPRSTWWYDRRQGGGTVNGFMPHLVDLGLWLSGRTPLAAYGFMRTANPQRRDPDGNVFEMTAADGGFAVADLGDGIAARFTLDGTLSMNQATIALHAEERTAVASGPTLHDGTLFVIDGEESAEYALKPNPYEKHRPLHPGIPSFLRLLDDFARRIATGGGECPTFADGLAVQRVMHAIGYEF